MDVKVDGTVEVYGEEVTKTVEYVVVDWSVGAVMKALDEIIPEANVAVDDVVVVGRIFSSVSQTCSSSEDKNMEPMNNERPYDKSTGRERRRSW